MATGVSDRKAQIIFEATRLFSQEGYDGVTMKRLAAACGITEPALYRHFTSKDALYNRVLASTVDRLENKELFHRLENESDVETLLTELAGHILSFYSKNADLYRLLLFAALSGHTKAKQVYDSIRGTYVKFLVKQFDRLFTEGNIIKKHNDITARCFIGMVFDCSLATTLWKGFQGRVHKPADVIANNIPIYVRGLKT
jgi:AcrR family transcriptional regulator